MYNQFSPALHIGMIWMVDRAIALGTWWHDNNDLFYHAQYNNDIVHEAAMGIYTCGGLDHSLLL